MIVGALFVAVAFVIGNYIIVDGVVTAYKKAESKD